MSLAPVADKAIMHLEVWVANQLIRFRGEYIRVVR